MEKVSYQEQMKREMTVNKQSKYPAPKIPKEDKLKKYFRLEAKKEDVRLLPFPDGEFYKDVKFVKTKINGKYKDVVSLDNKGIDLGQCPYGVEYNRIKATMPHKDFKNLTEEQKFANKEVLMKMNEVEQTTYRIFKMLDRGKPKDGVKFWKIKIDRETLNLMRKGESIEDFEGGSLYQMTQVILEVARDNDVDINDYDNGFDIIVETKLNTLPANKSVTYRTISSIRKGTQCPVYTDKAVYNQIVNDDLEWLDVYSPGKAPDTSEEEYLKLCLTNDAPYWLDGERKWVFPRLNKIEEDVEKGEFTHTVPSDDDLPF